MWLLPHSKRVLGLRNRSSLGPTPRGRLKFGRMLAFRTRAARNRRVKDARRSVTGPLSAASARYLRIGDSDFGAVNTGKRDFSKWRQPIYTQTGSFSCDSPPRFPLVYSRTVQDGRYLPKVAAPATTALATGFTALHVCPLFCLLLSLSRKR